MKDHQNTDTFHALNIYGHILGKSDLQFAETLLSGETYSNNINILILRATIDSPIATNIFDACHF